jgi:hypothetical protein
LSAFGLALTTAAVTGGARLGTASAPFLGAYRWQLGPGTLLAPAIAVAVIVIAARGVTERLPWPVFQLAGYGTALGWALALALVDGRAGLTRGISSSDEFLTDLPAIEDHPIGFLASFTDQAPGYSAATRGHPPGPLLLLWGLGRLGVTDHLAIGLLITALGALTVPLVCAAVRDSCGQTAARRYGPVLWLAPYAVWSAVSMDAVVSLLGAALVVAGVRASRRESHGWPAAGWAALAGLITGVAALFSYAAPWLGLSLVCVYFARRRAFLNVVTGLAALFPVLAAQGAGFEWVTGLAVAHADYGSRVEPYRSALWWSGISLVALLLAAGPPLGASARGLRNTPAWPFLAGAGSAVLFSVLAGLARGGIEHAWLPFFPWLTVAAVAPQRQGGPPPPAPLPLVALGAATAVVIEAVLATAW